MFKEHGHTLLANRTFDMALAPGLATDAPLLSAIGVT
jgi:hypothetical protein